MFHLRGGSRKSSKKVRCLRKTRAMPRAHVLRIQTLGVLRTIGIHLEGADVAWPTVDLEPGEETRMLTLRILVADHVVVGVEHLVSLNISNVCVVSGFLQAASHVDQLV